jgi:hypothetical protein
MAQAPFLTQHDAIVEAYESEDFLARLHAIINEKGALTAAEWQHELQEARNAAASHSAGYGDGPAR